MSTPPIPPIYNNNGKIINSWSTNPPAMQRTSIPSNNINGYNKSTITTNYMFNTQFRTNYFKTTPANCEFPLPVRMDNVVAMSLSAIQIPNVMLTFSDIRGTNVLYIKEATTDNEALVEIPSGNYTAGTDADNFPAVLAAAINAQVNGGGTRFSVAISPTTNRTTISNTTYNFHMNIIRKDRQLSCLNFEHSSLGIPDKESANPKAPGIAPSEMFNSMGYFMGFRIESYFNKMSYTSESNFDPTFTDYVYVVIKDYTGNTQTTTNCIGVLPNYTIKGNILAIVPITSEQFTTTFVNAGDLIYRTREYFSPVNINKIGVEILNQYGETLDLYLNDYAFVLEVVTLYNNERAMALSVDLWGGGGTG